MTKILFLITKSNWGGAQKYVFDLATEFQKKNYAVSVALGGTGELSQRLQKLNIPVLNILNLKRDISLTDEIKSVLSIWKIIKKEKPDILHLNSSKAGGLGSVIGKLNGVKKIIFTVHGLALNEDRPFYQRWLIQFSYFLTILFCDETIVVSNALKTQIVSMFPFFSKKITVIHNSTQVSFLEKTEAQKLIFEKAKKTDFPQDAVLVATVGELHPIKGHKYLVEGFKKVITESKFPLFLFISGEGEEHKKTQEQIDSLGLSKHIFLLGHVENAPETLKAFDIFILPSISEAIGYVILEAGLAGLPVIATNVGGIPEIIENKVDGILINPKSPEEVQKSLILLGENSELRKELGRKLQEKVEKNFKLETMIEKTEEVYKKI